MADEKQEAAEAAKRARGEAKAAAKDTARAANAAAHVVAEEARQETAKLEGTVQDAAQVVKKISIPDFLINTSMGLACTSVSLVFGVAAVQSFKNAANSLKR